MVYAPDLTVYKKGGANFRRFTLFAVWCKPTYF